MGILAKAVILARQTAEYSSARRSAKFSGATRLEVSNHECPFQPALAKSDAANVMARRQVTAPAQFADTLAAHNSLRCHHFPHEVAVVVLAQVATAPMDGDSSKKRLSGHKKHAQCGNMWYCLRPSAKKS